MKQQTKTIPMNLWAIIGVVILALMSYSYFTLDTSEPRLLTYFNHTRLVQAVNDSSNRQKSALIVVMGSSMSYKALYFDGMMENFASQSGKSKIKFVRFIKMCGKLEDFTALFPEILNARPAAVFMEANLFTLDLDKACHNTVFEKYKKELRLYIRQVFDITNTYNYRVSRFNMITMEAQDPQQSYSAKKFDLQTYEKFYAGLHPRRFGLNVKYKNFIQNLRALGIDFILLDIPRSSLLETIFPSELDQSCRRLIERYQSEYGLKYQEFPFSEGVEYYFDYVHFNNAGQEVYSRWFLSQLDHWIKPQGEQ
jgi:hypothetical protein